MIRDYLELAGVEIWNHARLAAYVENGMPINLDTYGGCGCDTITAEVLGEDEPYDAPDTDPAPWFDEDVPASADFAGLMVLSVEGMDDNPYTREVTRGVTGQAAFGRRRVRPREITVTAVLLGSTCCGVDYGLKWLAEALAGCQRRGCDGDDACGISCCPPEEPATAAEFDAEYTRTLRRVALVEGPTVVDVQGDGCTSGQCQTGADLITVEFVLVAAIPWQWTCPVPVLEASVPLDEPDECLHWCVQGGPPPPEPTCVELVDNCDGDSVDFGCDVCPPGTVAWPDDTACPGEDPFRPPCDEPCHLAACADLAAACADPTCVTPTPPTAPPPDTCFCAPIAVDSNCYEIDLTDRTSWFGAAPIITVDAGSSDLRRLSIQFYERTPANEGMACWEIAENERCHAHSVYEIGFVPAGGRLVLDGQVGRASITCGGVTESSQNVWGRDGTPTLFELLDCGQYCVCLVADAIFAPAADASVKIEISGREF